MLFYPFNCLSSTLPLVPVRLTSLSTIWIWIFITQFCKIKIIHSQRLIYSINRYSTDVDNKLWSFDINKSNLTPNIPFKETNQSQESLITANGIKIKFDNYNKSRPLITRTEFASNNTKDVQIQLRSKRFVHRMIKTPKLYDNNKLTSKNPSTSHSGSLINDSNGNVNDSSFGSKHISVILAEFLDDYDHNQRPGYGGPPVVITTNLEIRSMGPISELDMEYSLDCYFRQKWKDERLRFTGNADFLSFSIKMLDKIWKPDTYFHTGKASHLHMITTPNKFLRIFKNGLILYSMRLTIKSLCPMDLHSFPMDKQSCPLILGSYGFPNDQLVYTWDKKPVTFNQKDFTLSQFDIVKTIYRNGTFRFKRGNHSMLQVNFNLRRHVGYFLIQIYVPCSLIVVLSWVSFWINREATSGLTKLLGIIYLIVSLKIIDRVGLGVTAVLTLSTFGLDSRSDLPRVSYATALDWYTVMCFLFVVFTLLEFAGVHYFTKVGTGEIPIIEIDDNWTKSSSNDEEDNMAEEDRSEENQHGNTTYHQHPYQFYKKHANYPHRTYNNRLRRRRQTIAATRRGKIRPSKCKNDTKFYKPQRSSYENNYEKRFKDYGQEMDHSEQIIHMPHCPRYVQRNNRPFTTEDCWMYPSSSSAMNVTSNQYNLKLNSSWPKLAWECVNQPLKSSDMPEHYSMDQLYHLANVQQEQNKFPEMNCLKVDNNELNANEESEPSSDEKISFWLFQRFLNLLSGCFLQFWYCFTANEQYKKEMIKRRGKSQTLCAVNSVSMIDKVSRILFPLVFFILNMAYWSFYINERNADFIQWNQNV